MGSRGTTTSRTGSKQGRRRWAAGFTLVELVIVAVVMTVLLVASVPQFQRTLQRLRAEQAAFEVAQLLRVSRERAVAEGRPMVWVWDSAAHRARVEPAPFESGGSVAETSPRIITGAPLPHQMALRLLRGEEPAESVTFFPDGTSEPAAISLSLGVIVYQVDVDATTGQPALSAGTPAR